MNSTLARLKSALGCWLFERWKIEFVLIAPALAEWFGLTWLELCNRNETLTVDDVTGGRVCQWPDSSLLTAVSVFPSLGARLSRRLLMDWPVGIGTAETAQLAAAPAISFLVPICGVDRLDQFFSSLKSALGQVGVSSEVVVVEQSSESLLAKRLPHGVTYLHQLCEINDQFNKSRALNAAARLAQGAGLIILDADLVLPNTFAETCHRALVKVDAVRPVRWLLYLLPPDDVQGAGDFQLDNLTKVESIVSNTPMPIALRRSAYWEIGGHDEAYIGWGGEDTEFLDRLRTKNVSQGGWLPIWHLWHAPAAKKADGSRNRDLHLAKMRVPAQERITRLVQTLDRSQVNA